MPILSYFWRKSVWRSRWRLFSMWYERNCNMCQGTFIALSRIFEDFT